VTEKMKMFGGLKCLCVQCTNAFKI